MEDGQLIAVQRRAYYDSRRLGAQSLTFLFETDADARQQLFEDGKADFLLGLTEQAVERRSDSWSAEPGFRVAALLVNQLAEATGRSRCARRCRSPSTATPSRTRSARGRT